MKTIRLNEVLAEVNQANAVFDLKYRKDDGSVGEKKKVVLRGNTNVLNERKKMNRSGVLKIYDPKSGDERDITIDLITMFNGMRVLKSY